MRWTNAVMDTLLCVEQEDQSTTPPIAAKASVDTIGLNTSALETITEAKTGEEEDSIMQCRSGGDSANGGAADATASNADERTNVEGRAQVEDSAEKRNDGEEDKTKVESPSDEVKAETKVDASSSEQNKVKPSGPGNVESPADKAASEAPQASGCGFCLCMGHGEEAEPIDKKQDTTEKSQAEDLLVEEKGTESNEKSQAKAAEQQLAEEKTEKPEIAEEKKDEVGDVRPKDDPPEDKEDDAYTNDDSTNDDYTSDYTSVGTSEVSTLMTKKSDDDTALATVEEAASAEIKESKSSDPPPEGLKTIQEDPKFCVSAKAAMDDFKITEIPTSWDNPTLSAQTRAKDELVWKEYLEARLLLKKACYWESKDPNNRASQAYVKMIRERLEADWKTRILGAVMLKHTYQRANNIVLKNPWLETATIASTIFSPYLLPRAVQLCHLYKRSVGGNEFKCSWHIQFVSLADGAEARSLGRSLMSYYWRPHMVDMVELCSNEYLENPTNEVGWVPIENITTDYFTPAIVRKIRKWLFGHYSSYRLFTDFDMMKYLFGTCGAVDNMNILHGSIGHRWKATPTQAEDMKVYGELRRETIENAKTIGTNWLEFHSRLVCSALRPVDQWYDPYDQRGMKGAWGAAVLNHRREVYPGIHQESEEEREQPWIVWNESLKSFPTFEGNEAF